MGNPEQLKRDPEAELALDDAAICSRFDELAHKCEGGEQKDKKKKPQIIMTAGIFEKTNTPEIAEGDQACCTAFDRLTYNQDNPQLLVTLQESLSHLGEQERMLAT